MTGLTNDTAYRFKVRAVNSVGNGAASAESSSVTPAATAPPAPGQPTGTAGDQSVALAWTSGGNGGSTITKWQYQKKSTGDYGSWTDHLRYPHHAHSVLSTTSYTVTGLTNGTAYKFKVRSLNSVGDGGASPESDAITPATVPPAPGKPTGTARHQSVALSWTSGGDGGGAITKWQYQKKEGNTWGSGWSDICTSSDTGLSEQGRATRVTGLTNDTAYKFKVSRGQPVRATAAPRRNRMRSRRWRARSRPSPR